MFHSQLSHHSGAVVDLLEARALLSGEVIASSSGATGTPPTTPPVGVVVPPTPAPNASIGVGITFNAVARLAYTGDVGLIKNLKLAATDIPRYTVSINWGDGTAASGGRLTVDSTGLVHVQGTHTYAKAGTFAVVTQVSCKPLPIAAGTSAVPRPTPAPTPIILIKSKAIVSAPMIIIRPIAGRSFTLVVAKFVMPPIAVATPVAAGTGSSAIAVAPVASIDWGDGSTSIGKIVSDSTGTSSVIGTHTYQKVGQYKIHVLVTLGPQPGPGPQPMGPAAPTPGFPTRIIADIWSLAIVTAGTTATAV